MRAPFVQPAIGRDFVIQTFIKTLKLGWMPCSKLFGQMSRIAGGDDNVVGFLGSLAQSWQDSHNEETVNMFSSLEPEKIKKLLTWWHSERNMRRLYLLGINKTEINACRLTCDQIYEKCSGNPYVLPAIPLEKCADILDRLNKKPKEEEKTRGEIIRYIWKFLHSNGWSGVPTKILVRQYPQIMVHLEELKKNYGMVAELETNYLTFPHKVEVFLAEYFTQKRTEDRVNYDSPLDVEDASERIAYRKSAHYTREMSEDQKKAIQGALDHSVSVVTGGAGTGKCLGKDTPILMFNGEIKLVQDVVSFDLLMGPDSLPRVVNSVITGFSDLYEVRPKFGRSFVCNNVHVLTLTRKSFIRTTEYETIDVPVDIFLKRTDQEQWQLYHVGVEFPAKEIGIDPYLIGFWLGHGLENLEHTTKLHTHQYHRLASFTKHLPDVYKINSREVRMQVLAGVIDKSGKLAKNGVCVLLRTKPVAESIEYLANSLGFAAEILSAPTKFIVAIKGDRLDTIPCLRHDRKPRLFHNRFRANCTGFEVRNLGPGNYYGFTLSGESPEAHRFLLGDFLVTHNTTCITQIVHNLELRGVSYALCSFTGKAVARLREVTKKRNSSTMHRLISRAKKNQLDLRPKQFEKDLPLHEYEHIVIDEASMVTSELLYDFLREYPKTKRLTLVGDANQLPPIGWGSMFQQLMKSETVPTYRLTTNYRVYVDKSQKDRDGVILNANAIISHDSQYPFAFVPTKNFSVIEGPIERVYDIVSACHAGGILPDQIVVITPFTRFLDILNKTFQQIYNMGARSIIDSRGTKWMIGDRVMLTSNDEEIGVFNGESGLICDITEKAILVDFRQSGCHEFLLEPSLDRVNVEQGFTKGYYRRGKRMEESLDGDEGDADERTVQKLLHSFALTVDKSQGSEWDFVIVYIPEFNTGSFLNKNRIYTAITRTKRCCWCVVSDIALMEMAAVKIPPYRCENLARRLGSKLPKLLPYEVLAEANLEMKNNLPADYMVDPDDTPTYD